MMKKEKYSFNNFFFKLKPKISINGFAKTKRPKNK